VVDSETGEPLAGAVIRIRRGPPAFLTDSVGRFVVSDLPAGELEVSISLIGYIQHIWKLTLQPNEVVDRVFSLDFSGERLPDVVVRARAEKLMPRYLDFERRRQRGLGAYLRWDELHRRNFASVGDAIRTLRGVRIHCRSETFECFAVMARTPNCLPTWWVDGVEVRSFHENTPIRDVYGIEVYRGAGEIPGEFAGSNAACGVIVLWTKSRPFR
jgi:hypothetical protein